MNAWSSVAEKDFNEGPKNKLKQRTTQNKYLFNFKAFKYSWKRLVSGIPFAGGYSSLFPRITTLSCIGVLSSFYVGLWVTIVVTTPSSIATSNLSPLRFHIILIHFADVAQAFLDSLEAVIIQSFSVLEYLVCSCIWTSLLHLWFILTILNLLLLLNYKFLFICAHAKCGNFNTYKSHILVSPILNYASAESRSYISVWTWAIHGHMTFST